MVRAVRAAHILICSMLRIYYQIGKIYEYETNSAKITTNTK